MHLVRTYLCVREKHYVVLTWASFTVIWPLSRLPWKPAMTFHTRSPGRTRCTKLAGKNPNLSLLFPWLTYPDTDIHEDTRTQTFGLNWCFQPYSERGSVIDYLKSPKILGTLVSFLFTRSAEYASHLYHSETTENEWTITISKKMEICFFTSWCLITNILQDRKISIPPLFSIETLAHKHKCPWVLESCGSAKHNIKYVFSIYTLDFSTHLVWDI